MRKVIFVTYASGSFKRNIFWNKFFVKAFIRPDLCLFLTDSDLKKTKVYSDNQKIFDSDVGAGFWAWKPWAISEAFKVGKEGDVVIYQDCGKGLRYKNFLKPTKLINYALKNDIMPGVFVPEHGVNRDWTHSSCFKTMGCDYSEYHNTPQVEAAISVWKICSRSVEVLEDWNIFCRDNKAISDEFVSVDDTHSIKGHRYDQSILTNLVVKYDLKPVGPHFVSLHIFKSLSLLELHMRGRIDWIKLVAKLSNLKARVKRKL